jgi:CRP-like cAMP-binding protein
MDKSAAIRNDTLTETWHQEMLGNACLHTSAQRCVLSNACVNDPESVLMVVEGIVKAFVRFDSGLKRTITLLRPGQFFGPAINGQYAVADHATSISYSAMSECTYVAFKRTEFDRLLGQIPELALSYFQQLTTWVSLRQQQVSDICFENAVGRMRSALVAYGQSHMPEPRDGKVIINPSRKELSLMTGVSQAHAIRNIRVLADSGEIEMIGRYVIFPADGLNSSRRAKPLRQPPAVSEIRQVAGK